MICDVYLTITCILWQMHKMHDDLSEMLAMAFVYSEEVMNQGEQHNDAQKAFLLLKILAVSHQ